MHGKELLGNFTCHQKYRKGSHNETDVRHIWKVESNNQIRSLEWIQFTGVILHGNIYLWLVMEKSSASRTQRSTYSQILFNALEKMSSGRTSWRGSRVHHNTELWTQLMVSQRNSSGIFSHDSPHCSSATKSKSSCLKWAINQKYLKDGSSSCRCSMTSHRDLEKISKNAMLTPTSFLIYARRFSPGRWSFLGPGSEKKVVFYTW